MVGSEIDALKAISKHGGKLSIAGVAQELNLKMGVQISNDYARMLCLALGRDDYIDVSASGTCTITPKGEEFLKKSK